MDRNEVIKQNFFPSKDLCPKSCLARFISDSKKKTFPFLRGPKPYVQWFSAQ